MKRRQRNIRSVEVRFDETQEQFAQIHKNGARIFGTMWLSINESVANTASSHVDIADPAVKEMLSHISLRILTRLEALKLVKANREERK